MFFNTDNIWLLGLGGLFIYYNRQRIPYIMNDAYLGIVSIKNNLTQYKSFSKKVEYKEIDNIISAEYYHYGDKFMILGDSMESIIYPPYKEEEIQEFKDNKLISNMVKSKNDIIYSELVYTVNENEFQTDVLAIIQKLCGPLVNFYKNTPNRLSKNNIIIFFTDYISKKHDLCLKKNNDIFIKNINIMMCDGNEIDLLNY